MHTMLRQRFGASEQEVAEFVERCRYTETLT